MKKKASNIASKRIDFRTFFEEELLNSKDKTKNAKEFVENLDIVIRHTTYGNYDWLSYDIVIFRENFLDKLAECIRKNGSDIKLISIFQELGLKLGGHMFTPNIIDALYDANLDDLSYLGLFKCMYLEERLYFIKENLNKKVPIDFSIFPLFSNEKKFIEDNILEFASFSYNVLKLKKFCKKSENMNKLNSYIDNNKNTIIESIIDSLEIKFGPKPCNSAVEVLQLIVNDIISNEKASAKDIRLNDDGHYSLAIVIGNKVLKISEKRKTYRFSNNPYIVKPLIRRELDFGNEKYFIEVTEKVDNNTDNIRHDDLYDLYKKIRKLGLIWTDIKPDNVGYLLKDNEIYWNSTLIPTDDALGLDPYVGNDIHLKKGDLVVLDADYIFSDDSYAEGPRIYYDWEDFELRYQDEKRRINKMLYK